MPCYVCGDLSESAFITGDPTKAICHPCIDKQRSIYRNPRKSLHIDPDYVPANPPKPRRLILYGDGILFYAYDLDDPEKIWVDPGAVELFLNCLHYANELGVSVYRLIVLTPEVADYLGTHWFIVPEKQEYSPRFWVATL